MKNRRSGSLLITAVIAVTVITMLALALASRLRSEAITAESFSYIREVRHGCLNAATICISERLVPDTNGWDAVTENWATPFERRAEEWILRVSGTGWKPLSDETDGLIDESSRLPLNDDSDGLIPALLSVTLGMSDSMSKTIADAIEKNKPFVCIEQLAAVPGITPEIYSAISPFLTVFPVEAVNINTAPEKVLEAIFQYAGTHDAVAAHNLFMRIHAFRSKGNYFTSSESSSVARSLGGLPPNESLMLRYCQKKLTVNSDIFSGTAEATPARFWEANRKPGIAYFTYDRKKQIFLRWVDEQ